ncbi:hypothetical protein [Jeotgalibacillus marinus]|uniref:RNA polymerase sigma factor 70 region 4 type 2 domain-containing protein n=1 Tax=Jeotgalibacillus marinus TaxID=86667 RepID=A0ABV3Q450_9BACL
MDGNRPTQQSKEEIWYESVEFIEQHVPRIEHFFIQLGTSKEDIPQLVCAVFEKYKQQSTDSTKAPSIDHFYQIAFAVHKKEEETRELEQEGRIHEERLFVYAEDQQLHDAIQLLPLNERAIIILTFFHSLNEIEISKVVSLSCEEITSELKVSWRKLTKILSDQEGADLTEEQVGKWMSFLDASYSKMQLISSPNAINEQLNKEHQPSVQQVKKYQSKFFWLAVAAPIVLTVGLAFLIPTGEQEAAGEGDGRGTEEENIEEGLAALDQAFEARLPQLAEDLGLSVEELNELTFVIDQKMWLEDVKEMIESEEALEVRGHFADFDLDAYAEDILAQLVPPLEFLSFEYNETKKYTDDITLADSDLLAYNYLYRINGLSGVYNQKLNEYQIEFGELKGQPFTDESLPKEIEGFLDKIHQNGFVYTFITSTETFEVKLGGEYFNNQISVLDPLYQNYLQDRPSLPFVIGEDMQMSYSDATETLIKAEQWLKDIEKGTSENMWNEIRLMPVFNELAMQHRELLTRFILGSFKDPVFQEGLLRQEVKQAWETVIKTENADEYETTSIVNEHYEKLAETDFTEIRDWYDRNKVVETTYDSQAWYDPFQNFTIPLENEVSDIFTQYQQENDVEILKQLSAHEVVQFYLHAIFLGDIGTAFSLLADTEDRPSEEQFIAEIERESLYTQDFSELGHVSINYEDEEYLLVSVGFVSGYIFQIMISDEGEVYKVVYDQGHFLE